MRPCRSTSYARRTSSISGHRWRTKNGCGVDRPLANRDRAAYYTFSGAVHLHSSPQTIARACVHLTARDECGRNVTSFYDAAFAGPVRCAKPTTARTMLAAVQRR